MTDNSIMNVIAKLPTVQAHDGPVILHEGRYRLYEKPDGTLRVQYKRDDAEEEEWVEIPGIMVKMTRGMQDGSLSPMQLIGEATKMMMSMK